MNDENDSNEDTKKAMAFVWGGVWAEGLWGGSKVEGDTSPEPATLDPKEMH